MGTPDVNVWPDVKNLAHYKDTFPRWESQNPEMLFQNLESNGIHLLTRMLCYDPSKRITAKQALLHVYYFIYRKLFSLILKMLRDLILILIEMS